MSAELQNMLLGPGKLFFKRHDDADGKYRLVGNVNEAEITYEAETIQGKAGDMLGPLRRDRVDEKLSLKCKVVDFKVQELIASLGLSISTTQLTLTASIRLSQEITTVSTTTTKSLSQTPKSITSVAFTSLDRATDFVKSTDWTSPTAKKYRALSASFKNGAAIAHYTKRFTTARKINIGDNHVLQIVSLMYVHQRANKKSIALVIPKATVAGGLTMPFKEKEYTAREMTFEALADPTLLRGRKLGYFAVEP